MKLLKNALLGLILTISLLFTSNQAEASHYAAVHLYYDYAGPGPIPGSHRYAVTLSVFRDCSGANYVTNIIQISAPSCGISSYNYTLPPVGTPTNVTGNLCPNVPNTCNNINAPYNGYEEWLFRDTITLNQQCSDWTFKWIDGARNGAILNGFANQNICITAKLNNIFRANQSSTRYKKWPIPYVCINQPWTYINQPLDPNSADSAFHTSVVPSGDCISNLLYSGGYSLINPINSGPQPYLVSSSTATATFRAQTQGAFAVKFHTDDYDRATGTWVGSVERDVQINVVNCNSTPPAADSFLQANGMYALIDSLEGATVVSTGPSQVTIGTCPGNTVKFKVKGTCKSVSNSLTCYADNGLTCPGSTFLVPQQNVTPINGYFTWTPTASNQGNNPLVISIVDSTCTGGLPLILYTYIVVNIQVLPGVEAGPDKAYCGNTSDTVKITATGPNGVSQWNWIDLATGNPATNLTPTSGSNSVLAYPTSTTTYVLLTNANTACKNSDTVTVNVYPPIAFDAGPGGTICANQIFNFTPTVGLHDSLAWSPNYNLVDSTVANTSGTPTKTTTYKLKVVDQNGCRYTDSTQVIVNGVAPNINAWAEQDTICPNGSVQLHSVAVAQSCGLALSVCGGTPMNKLFNSGTLSNQTIFSPFYKGTSANSNIIMQYILTKAELNAMGIVGANYIESIGFHVTTKGANIPMRNYRVSMACVDNQFYSNSSFLQNVNSTVFFRDSLNTTVGLNTLSFDNPYYWDGNTNLAFQICYKGTGGSNDAVQMLTGNNTMMVYAPTATAYCNIASAVGNGYAFRPKMTIAHCEEPSYTLNWSPSTYLTPNASATNPLAVGVNTNPMTWTVTASSSVNSNCTNSKAVTVYTDQSSTVNVKGYAPSYLNGAIQYDSILLCDNPALFYLDMDTTFAQPTYNCDLLNSICPTSSSYSIAPQSLSINGNFYTPFSPTGKARRSQYLIKATELAVAGISAGELKSLSFNVVSKLNSSTYENFFIKMACTSDTSLFSGINNTANMKTVYQSSSSGFNTNLGWNKIPFQQNYGWDGVSNLIVEICWFTPSMTTYTNNALTNWNDVLETSIYPYTVAQYRYSIPTNPISVCDNSASLFLTNNGVGSTIRPNFKFEKCGSVSPSFYWTPGAFINDTTKKATFGIGVVTGWINGWARNRNGCWLKDSIKLIVPQHNYAARPIDTFICSTNQARFNANAGDKANGYLWIPSTLLDDPTSATPLATPTQGGTYPYQVVWTDGWGCQDTGSVNLHVWDTPVVSVYPIVDTVLYGNSIQLNGSGAVYYSWSPIQYLSNPFSPNPLATPLDSTLFTLIGIDSNGCKGSALSKIYVDFKNNIFIPTAFSPNGDGNNDVFKIYNLRFQVVQGFAVYDRWGVEVFNGNKEGSYEWDGTYKNKPVEAGVYVYVIKVATPDGTSKLYQGDITLMR